MPAETEEQLYNFEGNLEANIGTWLATKSLDTILSDNTETADDDFLHPEIELGAATGHVGYKADGTTQEYDQYEFTLSIRVRTTRINEEESGTEGITTRHYERVALLRKWLSTSRATGDGNLEGALEFYEFQYLLPAGTDYDPAPPNFDETTLSYTGQFSILPSAWPVS